MVQMSAPDRQIVTVIEAPRATDRATWRIVPERTTISWSAAKRYLMVIPVRARGQFTGAEGTVVLNDDDPTTARVDLAVPTTAQDSGLAKRDRHLAAADFFDADNHPRITFRSESVRKVAGTEDRYEVSGTLGIRGGSYPITLEGAWYELSGGRAWVELSGIVSRASLGLSWNARPILNLLDPIALAIEAELEPVTP